jgi:hypothetical protein
VIGTEEHLIPPALQAFMAERAPLRSGRRQAQGTLTGGRGRETVSLAG